MLRKDKAKNAIDHIPKTFSVDDIAVEINLLQKMEIARQQFQNGEFFTVEELDEEIDW